jgi:L-gulonolactone oxidase
VHGGIMIRELNEVLAANGLAVITLGGVNVQTLAGAIATSTHGGTSATPLPDVVQAVHRDRGWEAGVDRAGVRR